jgi:hypothetical protein
VTRAQAIKKYTAAIEILYRMGLRQSRFFGASQASIRSILEGRRGLAAFDIDPVTKRLLTTDENYALASAIVAQCESALDMQLVSPGRDWIFELESRAYGIGNKFQLDLNAAMGRSVAVGLRGVDATTLKLIREQGFEKIVGLAADQVDYLRTMLTKGIIENRTWRDLERLIIRDGKIPALVTSNGRLIEMGTRVDTIVRTETSRIAEQGTRDKAREIYGDAELAMRWHTIMDGREREAHADRHLEVRLVKDWESKPHPSDGKAIMPGEEINCRCWGEYAPLSEFGERSLEAA